MISQIRQICDAPAHTLVSILVLRSTCFFFAKGKILLNLHKLDVRSSIVGTTRQQLAHHWSPYYDQTHGEHMLYRCCSSCALIYSDVFYERLYGTERLRGGHPYRG